MSLGKTSLVSWAGVMEAPLKWGALPAPILSFSTPNPLLICTEHDANMVIFCSKNPPNLLPTCSLSTLKIN